MVAGICVTWLQSSGDKGSVIVNKVPKHRGEQEKKNITEIGRELFELKLGLVLVHFSGVC